MADSEGIKGVGNQATIQTPKVVMMAFWDTEIGSSQ